MKLSKLALLGVALALIGICSGCNKLRARSELNKGTLAFRNAQYPQAVNHFQQAVSYEPNYVQARLYLATSYAVQYAPGGESTENVKIGEQAIKAFQSVLQLDPKNTDALGSIAQIYYSMKNFDNAKQYQFELMKLQPNNPDPYYWIGVLDWYPCYKRQTELRVKLRLDSPKNPKQPGILPPLPAKDRDQLAEQNGTLVDEGIKYLEKAIALKPNYANAYSYLNLMYRQKADLEADEDARMADLKKADELTTKALALMKASAAKPKATSG
ncbi:MAG: tetratricopeptide repeat protein [Terriglobia bacterium]